MADASEGETLFQILDVSETASEDDIKKSFRKLALKYHPDKNPDGVEMFQKLQNAYDILADPEQRNQYLQLLAIQRNKSKLEKSSIADLKTKFRQFHDFRSNHRRKYERTCRDWARGKCENDACPYWHYKSAPSGKRDQICKEYLAGTCKFGDECIFAHTNVIPTDDNDATYAKEWRCKTPGCAYMNELGKPMCSRCKQRRSFIQPRFKNGQQVMLSHNKIQTIDEVIRLTLFLIEDGKTKQELTTIITQMKQLNLFGQVMGMVLGFYPSSECYMLRLIDGSHFICPETYCQSGTNRWTCERCKFSNLMTVDKCKLCHLSKEGEEYERRMKEKEEKKRKRSRSRKRRSSRSRSRSRGKSEKDKMAVIIAPDQPKTLEEQERESQWVEAKRKRQEEREARIAQRQREKEMSLEDDEAPVENKPALQINSLATAFTTATEQAKATLASFQEKFGTPPTPMSPPPVPSPMQSPVGYMPQPGGWGAALPTMPPPGFGGYPVASGPPGPQYFMPPTPAFGAPYATPPYGGAPMMNGMNGYGY